MGRSGNLVKAFLRSIYTPIYFLVHSIRFRLTIWAVLILALVLAIFSGIVYSNQTQVVETNAANRLLDDFSRISHPYLILASPYLANGGNLPDLNQTIGPFLGNDIVLALINPQGKIVQQFGLSSTSNINLLLSKVNKNDLTGLPFTYELSGTSTISSTKIEDYMMVITPIQLERGGSVLGYLLMGEPADPGGQLPKLLLTLLLVSGSTLLVAIFGGYWLVARALHPVQTITHAAQEISETDLSRRLNLKVQDELGELANTFDRMLDRLQAAFDRQRQFTADASHELRTPLTIIDLESDRALARRRSPDEYEVALRTIKSENEFMTRLVNDLLTLARMDAGQAVMKLEELDLSEVVLDVTERLTPLARQKKVELVFGDMPELKVTGDRQYLSQMVINLVENAIKYITGKEAVVSIETGSDTGNSRSEAWFRVRDTGPGIAPEHLPHLFDRFYRVDKARSNDPGDGTQPAMEGVSSPSGSGLGLSIVQWIAKAHGGSVSVQSEVGKGSTFEVRMPFNPDNHIPATIKDPIPIQGPLHQETGKNA